ncbi:hypothetical protein Patl1_12537 [Pistacia atlantica]|uniref:Uncharacterized protein n=1 Tax=Pistacia atlantica TaxID=434234 RepID=A0ACC1AU79_9ROSI|nr:hypothetical protein Patl1_12537 [Pistacia atlantica]
MHPSQMDIIKRNPGRDDWWAGSAPSGPFIYTPFSKGDPNDTSKQELIWVVGEPVQVLVELANPCGFDLRVDSIYLSAHSENFDAFPISVDLPPNSSKVITLSGIPTSVGVVRIPGCRVHCFGVITEHLFRDVDNLLLGAAQGLVLSDPFRCCGSAKLKNVSNPNISVVSPLPLLVSHVVGGDGAIIFPGAEVTVPVTLKAWQLGLVDHEIAAGKSASGSTGRHLKDGSSPSLLIHYSARLLSMEIPAHVGENLPMPVYVDSTSTEGTVGSENKMDKLMKIDPFRGSWGLRFLELELSNPTDVVFEISVSVQLENSNNEDGLSSDQDATEYGYPKTRIDRDYTARVLIPLEHFKLPILDGSFFVKDLKSDGSIGSRNSSFSEKNTKAELNASIKNLISRIKVRWQSGRNSSGELNIKDAIQAALQTSVMDVLLPDPLTFGFRLVRKDF